MSGATTGLADTFIASLDNPAGPAMTVNGGDINFTGNNVHDSYVQNYESAIKTWSGGALLTPYPWGFGFGYASLSAEGQEYQFQGSAAPASVNVTAGEYQLSLSRVFWDDRISLGSAIRIGQADAEIGSETAHGYDVGLSVGGMLQFKRRWLLGLSYSTPMHYAISANQSPSPLPGFYQNINVPSRTSVGIGWIPNRFFRGSFSLTRIGVTRGAALLSNDDILVGNHSTIQPRLGFAYVFADFKNFSATLFGGSYLEVTRIAHGRNRVHVSAGVEAKPWIFTMGLGIDVSKHYRNYLASFGLDVFKVMQKLDLIPTPWRPGYAGFGVDPRHLSDEGLPRPLVENWRQRGPRINALEAGLNIPNRIEQKVQDLLNPSAQPAPEPPRAKPKTRRGKNSKAPARPKPRPTPKNEPPPL